MRLFIIPPPFTAALFVFLAALALWRGDWRARTIGVAQAGDNIVGALCHIGSCRLYHPPPGWWTIPRNWIPATHDGFILAVCLVCAAKANRYWCILAAAFALLGEINDLTIFAAGVTRWAWLSGSLFWTYAVGAAVLWGVLTRDRPRSAGSALEGSGAD